MFDVVDVEAGAARDLICGISAGFTDGVPDEPASLVELSVELSLLERAGVGF